MVLPLRVGWHVYATHDVVKSEDMMMWLSHEQYSINTAIVLRVIRHLGILPCRERVHEQNKVAAGNRSYLTPNDLSTLCDQAQLADIHLQKKQNIIFGKVKGIIGA